MIRTIAALGGKSLSGTLIIVMILYTAELYPTILRYRIENNIYVRFLQKDAELLIEIKLGKAKQNSYQIVGYHI